MCIYIYIYIYTHTYNKTTKLNHTALDERPVAVLGDQC